MHMMSYTKKKNIFFCSSKILIFYWKQTKNQNKTTTLNSRMTESPTTHHISELVNFLGIVKLVYINQIYSMAGNVLYAQNRIRKGQEKRERTYWSQCIFNTLTILIPYSQDFLWLTYGFIVGCSATSAYCKSGKSPIIRSKMSRNKL